MEDVGSPKPTGSYLLPSLVPVSEEVSFSESLDVRVYVKFSWSCFTLEDWYIKSILQQNAFLEWNASVSVGFECIYNANILNYTG